MYNDEKVGKIITLIDKRKLSKYEELYNIFSSKIILTNERKKHIYEKHFKDFNIIMKELKDTLDNPNEIRVNKIDLGEIHYIKKLEQNNLIEIIKMNISKDQKHPYNSIMTSWIINESKLNSIKKKTKNIYKK